MTDHKPSADHWPRPVATVEDCLAHMPNPLVTTSREKGWNDLTLDLHPQGGPFSLQIPPAHHLTITFALAGDAVIDHEIGGYRYRHAVQPGDINIFPAYMAHNCEGTAVPHSLVASLPARFIDHVVRSHTDGKVTKLWIEPAFCVEDPVLKAFGAILMAELQRPAHPGQPNYISVLATALTLHLARTCGAALPSPGARVRPLTRAALHNIDAFIESRLIEPVQLDDLAAVAGLSRFHFIRAFKAATSLTPMEYVERSRIDRARLLIASGEMSLAQVAHFIGFADQSHFTRRFKAYVGCTPGEYAKLQPNNIRLPQPASRPPAKAPGEEGHPHHHRRGD